MNEIEALEARSHNNFSWLLNGDKSSNLSLFTRLVCPHYASLLCLDTPSSYPKIPSKMKRVVIIFSIVNHKRRNCSKH